ncbi:MAG: hypothetical protein ACREQX_13440 [Candidatus Binataceae bacterium]
MMVKFPSTDYFDALKLRMQAEEQRFRRLGFIDTSFGLVIGENGDSRSFVLTFEVFELKDVREVPRIELSAVDFVIEGEAAVWREMLDNIRRHGEADTAHDINTLTHFGEALKVTYDNPEGHDKLYRFMESIQEFFDLSSQIEVSF